MQNDDKPFERGMAALFAGVLAVGAVGVAGSAAAQEDVFDLGKLSVITVVGERRDADATDNVVTPEDIWSFNRNTLDQAIKLVPGVSSTLDVNGRRNEHDVSVRGFGRWQVPLSIDGIQVYLPADNRLDFARFLTQDVAEVEVQKGYVSVLNGPGGMGGAINLVTRKPSQPFESEVRTGASEGEWDAYAMLGSRQDKFYLEGSYSYLNRDYWEMSHDFKPTALENGGRRDASDNQDSRANFKIGFTPNDRDEYSLSYTAQSGEKGAPLNVYALSPPNSYWRWPRWDIGNLYWLSSTELGGVTLKTTLFYNKFKNDLFAYDNSTYTTQSLPGRFRSYYDDTGTGGSVELDTSFGTRNRFGAAVHYRHDEHTEYNDNRPTSPARMIEPLQTTDENTWSVAVEDTFAVNSKLDLVGGLSHDANDLNMAQDYGVPPVGAKPPSTTAILYEYPTGGSDANNWQGAAYWRYADDRQIRGVISSRTRFPTVFERFSTRFGTAVPNPDLGPERALNYELGWSARLKDTVSLSTALFYADVQDSIQTVVLPGGLTQAQNVGNGEYYGVEFGVQSKLTELWSITANYTYLHRNIKDALQPGLEVTGAPNNQAFLAFLFTPSSRWTITPSVEVAGDQWSTTATTNQYVRTGSHTLVNFQVQYRGGERWEVSLGGTNLLDENYELAWGYPDPGRSEYVRMRLNF